MHVNKPKPVIIKEAGPTGTPVTFLSLVDIAFAKSCTPWILGVVCMVFFVNSVLGHESMSRFVQFLSAYTSDNFIIWWNALCLSFWMPPVILWCSSVIFNFMVAVIQKRNYLNKVLSKFILGTIVVIILIFGTVNVEVLDKTDTLVYVLGAILIFIIVVIMLVTASDIIVCIIVSTFIFIVATILFIFTVIFALITDIGLILEILKFQAVWMMWCVFVFGITFTMIAISRLRIFRAIRHYM